MSRPTLEELRKLEAARRDEAFDRRRKKLEELEAVVSSLQGEVDELVDDEGIDGYDLDNLINEMQRTAAHTERRRDELDRRRYELW